MSLTELSRELLFPTIYTGGPIDNGPQFNMGSGQTLDAANEKAALCGYLVWQGRATSKAVSKIHFRTDSVTYADAGSSLRVGLQDLATSAGPPTQPDGSFDIFDDIAGGDAELTSASDSTFVTATMTSGSKTLSTGDKIAVVWEMTARGGTDSVRLAALSHNTNLASPVGLVDTTGSWAVSSLPLVIIEASDGTLGTIVGTIPITASATQAFSDSSDPDEYGLVFKLPVEVKVTGVMMTIQSAGATSDFDINIFSDPFGTPAAVSGTTFSILGENGNTGGRAPYMIYFPAEVTLSAATDYVLALKATGAGNVTICIYTLRDAADRPLLGLNNCGLTTRNGGTGAFAATTTTQVPHFVLMISSVHDGSGGAGGSGGAHILGGTVVR